MLEKLIKKRRIFTDKGEYHFRPVPLYFGRTIMNEKQALENLKVFKAIMDENAITFGLFYGTLLGAVRNSKFIEFDEDIDVFVFEENLPKLLNLLHSFRELGFEVARYRNDLLTLIRNDESIDINIFRKINTNQYQSYNIALPSSFFENLASIDFYNIKIKIPYQYEEFLTLAYGESWRVPIQNMYATLAEGKQSFNRRVAKALPKKVSYLVHVFLLIIRK